MRKNIKLRLAFAVIGPVVIAGAFAWIDKVTSKWTPTQATVISRKTGVLETTITYQYKASGKMETHTDSQLPTFLLNYVLPNLEEKNSLPIRYNPESPYRCFNRDIQAVKNYSYLIETIIILIIALTMRMIRMGLSPRVGRRQV